MSDEWLGLLSLTCPPSTITPPSPTHRLFKQDPNAGLYFVVSCAVPSGVCQSHINEDNDVLSLAFSPLSSSPQALARQEKKKKKKHTCIFGGVGASRRGVSVTSTQSLALFPLFSYSRQSSDGMHCVSARLNRVGW